MAPDRGSVMTDSAADPTADVDIGSSSLSTGNPMLAGNLMSTNSNLPAHLSHDAASNAKRTDPFQFGQRFLSDADDVFEFNAWDHVSPDVEYREYSEEQYQKQRSAPVSDFDKSRFNDKPEKWWDLFYKQKSSTFFKDRKWLFQEFPALHAVTRKDAGRKVVLEVGAGAGNTAFPILRMNENDDLMVHAYDFSKKAVETMRSSSDYDERHMRAEVWDVASSDIEDSPPAIKNGSVDVVIMIFIFSALSPLQWQQTVKNIHRILKPGGEVLFRDYGRGDLAQVRFKAGRWMEENFYVRGDGTRVYFFEKDELEKIWSGTTAPGTGSSEPNFDVGGGGGVCHTEFRVMNLDVDRRLIVNRQKKIKMYRCWIQGRFRKSDSAQE